MRSAEMLTLPIRVSLRTRLSSSEERYEQMGGWLVSFVAQGTSTVAIVLLDKDIEFSEFNLSDITVGR